MSVDLSFYRSKTSQRLRAEGRDEGRDEGRAEGRAEGRVEDVLRLLETRGIAVPTSAKERIQACTELAIVDRWFDRAITATDIAEVFAE